MRQHEKIRKPFVVLVGMRDKSQSRIQVMPEERLAHLSTYLEVIRSNCRAEPGHEALALNSHPGQGLFNHPFCQTFPARMNGACYGSGTVTQEYRKTLGYEHYADVAWVAAERRISLAGRAGMIIDAYRSDAVHLLQPSRFAG